MATLTLEGGYTAYSAVSLTNDYLSNATREPTFLDNSGYIFTDWFVGKVTNGQFLPDDILYTFDLDDIDAFVQELLDNWGTVMTYNWRVAVCVIFGFVMTLLVPIMGGVWCHKHRKGKWGGDRHGHPDVWGDDWASRVARQTALTFFALFYIVSVWGIVWHFMADELMGRGMRELPQNVDYIVKDTYTYLNNSVNQADHWRDVNFEVELRQNFRASLMEAAETMDETLTDIDLNFLHFDRVEGVPKLLVNVSHAFVDYDQDAIVSNMMLYESAVDHLDDETDAFVADPVWANILANCPVNCSQIEQDLEQLFIDYSLVPDPAAVAAIRITQKDFDNMDELISQTEAIRGQLDALGGQFIQDNEQVYSDILVDMYDYYLVVTDDFFEVMYTMLYEDPEVDETISEEWDKWFTIAYWTFMIPGMIMIIILLLYVISFFLGVCTSVDSEKKKHAAKISAGATGMFYVMAFVLWLTTTLLFIGGVALQELGCETLENPAESDLYEMLQSDINEGLREAFSNVTDAYQNTSWIVPEMLEQCENDGSLYVILHMEDVFDVEGMRMWKDIINVDVSEQMLVDTLNDTVLDVIDELYYPDMDLVEEVLAFQQTMFPVVNYTHQILYYDYDDVINHEALNELDEFLAELSTYPNSSAIASDIQKARNLCKSYNNSILTYSRQFHAFQNYTFGLMNTMDFAYQSVYERIDDVFVNVYRAKAILPTIAYMFEEPLLEEYNDTLSTIDGFVEFSVVFLEEDFGKCAPFYEIYLAGINYSCYMIVDPINNIWAAIGLVLLCFVPILVFVVFVEKIWRSVKSTETLVMVDAADFEDDIYKFEEKDDQKPYYYEADVEFAKYTKKYPPRPSLVPRASLVPGDASTDPRRLSNVSYSGNVLGLPPVIEGTLVAQASIAGEMNAMNAEESSSTTTTTHDVQVHTTTSKSSSD